MSARRSSPRALACVAAVAALATTACIATIDRATTGWAIFDWTLEQHHDASTCARYGAVTMAIAIEDEEHRSIVRATAPCRSFGAAVRLDDGRYGATLALLDQAGRPVSATVSVAPFVVWGAQAIHVTADFPASSFVAP